MVIERLRNIHVAEHQLLLIRPCTGKHALLFSDRPIIKKVFRKNFNFNPTKKSIIRIPNEETQIYGHFNNFRITDQSMDVDISGCNHDGQESQSLINPTPAYYIIFNRI